MKGRSKIEYCQDTWNPITGCRHGCHYCYARKMVSRFAGDPRLNKSATADYEKVPAEDGSGDVYVLEKQMQGLVYPFRFEPTFHRYRITGHSLERFKTGRIIFVGAMSDIWGSWVPRGWIEEILQECQNYPQHKYLFLTKNPARYSEFYLPDYWYGTSITTNADVSRIDDLPGGNNYLSIEPLRGPVKLKGLSKIKWIIIGAETGNRLKVVPEKSWIDDIQRQADGIPIFMKDSLIPIVGEENMRREHPDGMTKYVYVGDKKKKMCDQCAFCKRDMVKHDMFLLQARKVRGQWAKSLTYLCPECMAELCGKLGVEVPEFD